MRSAHTELDSPKLDMNTRQPDFYKSCDIIEFIDGEDAEGLQLANLFTSNGVKYIIKHACDYPSIDSLFADFTNCVLKRNSDARQNSEPCTCLSFTFHATGVSKASVGLMAH